ncbi:diguanylate cyclase domain-containing protein [Schinkia sp. CFF1]
MNSIFSPAVSLMKKLKYPHKFALIGIIILLPVSFMLYYFFSGMEDKIAFIEKEKIGIEYNLHLKNLLDELQQHRGMTNAYRNGDQSFKEEISIKESQIKLEISEIDAINKRLASKLQTKKMWDDVKNNWISFQANANNLTAQENLEMHTKVIAKLVLLMNHVGYTSNLYLDSRLENHHLIASYTKIPYMTEKIGQARAIGSGYLAKKLGTVEEKEKLFALSILIRATADDINETVKTVLNENITNKPLINSYLNESVSETEFFLDTLNNKVLVATNTIITPNYYFLLATKTIDSSYKLYEAEAQALSHLLDNDITHAKSQRNQVIFLFAIVLFILFYLFIAFYKSVRDTLLTFEQTAVKMANGDLKARVSLDTKDELKEAGDSFNIMAESLCDKIDELKEAEEALQEQKEFSDNLILNSTTATFVINSKGEITIWNKGLEKLTGIKAETVIGTSNHWTAFYNTVHPCLADLIIHEDHKTLYSLDYNRSALIPDALHSEGWFVLRDGVNHYLSFEAAPIYNRKGDVIAVIQTLMDMTEKKRTEDKIKYRAYHDKLTGLYNRSYLDKAIGKALLHAKSENRIVALLFIDLDGFKEVNDTYGHDIGDFLLKIVANRLKKYAGDDDTVARLGGDEFVILLQEIKKPSEAGMVAHNIIAEINMPIVINNYELSVGASIGISLFPHNGIDNVTLTKHADLAMYKAKRRGKNRFQFFTSLMCDPDCKLVSCLIKNLQKETSS